MTTVFADTQYWIANANPRDPWRRAARAARARLGDVRIVTTDEVLAEVLTGLSKSGSALRQAGVRLVHAILESPTVTVVSQSHESFLQGLVRYEKRADKRYSLTDCSSMNAADAHGITEVLTNDRHFEQEGYKVLIRA
jgi:predicted nucleic acid-binding protein